MLGQQGIHIDRSNPDDPVKTWLTDLNRGQAWSANTPRYGHVCAVQANRVFVASIRFPDNKKTEQKKTWIQIKQYGADSFLYVEACVILHRISYN